MAFHREDLLERHELKHTNLGIPSKDSTHTAIDQLDNSSPLDVAPEDPSSTIKCICEYTNDDGNTVYCEICDTWQHIECYYPTLAIPDVHECCNCRPRTLDKKSARERQGQLRELQSAERARRTKRPKATDHLKKTKDSVQLNDWPVAESENGLGQRSRTPGDQGRSRSRITTLRNPPTAPAPASENVVSRPQVEESHKGNDSTVRERDEAAGMATMVGPDKIW